MVVIGETGKNFAAGMSGGVAYVYDKNNQLYRNLNKDLVLREKVENKTDCEELKSMLKKHLKYTGSKKAKKIANAAAQGAKDAWQSIKEAVKKND